MMMSRLVVLSSRRSRLAAHHVAASSTARSNSNSCGTLRNSSNISSQSNRTPNHRPPRAAATPIAIRSHGHATTATTTSSSHLTLDWASVDPATLGSAPTPYAVQNLVSGQWQSAKTSMTIPNPMNKNGPPVCTLPNTSSDELGPYVASLQSVSKSGMHNPLRNVERYRQFGEISRKVSVIYIYLCIMMHCSTREILPFHIYIETIS
jgi:hypothetical protein